MSTPSKVCEQMTQECCSLLNTIYRDHNPDPLATAKSPELSDDALQSLCQTATTNELLKRSRGNGHGPQTIWSGMNSFAEIPVVGDDGETMSITQQQNGGHGFAFGNPATWIKRTYSDHMRRGKSTVVEDQFSIDDSSKFQPICAEPMKLDLGPDWSPDGKNFLNGQRVDTYYGAIGIWSSKALFNGSMSTPLADPRQITIIFQCGNGVIQCPMGVLPFGPGDLVQIPRFCPFTLFVNKGSTVRSICYYSVDPLRFPDRQLNVSDLNQIPFSPSIVEQCRFSVNESEHYPFRSEYVRVQQPDGGFALYHFKDSRTAFNWKKWVHQGPVLHKVNLVRNFERIGSSKGHKDPNIWLILQHSKDPLFGIAFITGTSLVEVGGAENDAITYPPAYFHLNGVHEKGEVVLFENESGGYDARKGFKDGDSLMHPAGIGHGGDREIYKLFAVKAIVQHILRRKVSALKAMDSAKYEQFMAMEEEQRRQRVNGFIAKSYALGFDPQYDHDQDIAFNVEKAAMRALDAVLDLKVALNEKGQYHALGMPFGIGYLLVECKDAPKIVKPQFGSTFGRMQQVSYGLGVADLITECNAYLRTLSKKPLRSAL